MNSFHNEVHSLQKICIPSVCVDLVVPDSTSSLKHAVTSSSVCLLLYNTVSQLVFITAVHWVSAAFHHKKVHSRWIVPEGHYPLWINPVG